MGDFQDLDHIDGLSASTTSAKLYSNKRLLLFVPMYSVNFFKDDSYLETLNGFVETPIDCWNQKKKVPLPNVSASSYLRLRHASQLRYSLPALPTHSNPTI